MSLSSFIDQGATFDVARVYRYRLWRTWDATLPRCVFIGLNPSTADEQVLDPTLRRCVDFARRWGCGRLDMLNLFALRSTDPEGLRTVTDPVGPENDRHLLEATREAEVVVAAWGAHEMALQRAKQVRRLLGAVPFECLGLTKSGQPRHPLYVRAETPRLPLREVHHG